MSPVVIVADSLAGAAMLAAGIKTRRRAGAAGRTRLWFVAATLFFLAAAIAAVASLPSST